MTRLYRGIAGSDFDKNTMQPRDDNYGWLVVTHQSILGANQTMWFISRFVITNDMG